MIFEGKYGIKTSREKVWTFITDPAKISRCLPGLKTLEIESEDRYVAVVRVGVGPIRTDFKFRIETVSKSPPGSVQLKAVGAGSGSSIIIDTLIELKEAADGTELSYSSDAKIGGIMMSLGQRVIKDAAEKMVSGIFECVKQQLE